MASTRAKAEARSLKSSGHASDRYRAYDCAHTCTRAIT